jgi:hypothetical protein
MSGFFQSIPRWLYAAILGVFVLVLASLWLWPSPFRPAHYMPRQAVMLVEWTVGGDDSSKTVLDQTQWGKLLQDVAGPKLHWLDSLPALGQQMPEDRSLPMGLGLFPGSTGRLNWVAVMPYYQAMPSLDSLMGRWGYRAQGPASDYQNVRIQSMQEPGSESEIAVAQTDGVLLVASNSIQLESCINALHHSEVRLEDALPSSADRLEGEVQVWFHFQALPALMKVFTQSQWHDALEAMDIPFPGAPFDLRYSRNRLSLYGSSPVTEQGSTLSRLPSQVDSLPLIDALPYHTAWAWIAPRSTRAPSGPADSSLPATLFPHTLGYFQGLTVQGATQLRPEEQRVALLSMREPPHDSLPSFEERLKSLSSRTLQVDGQPIELLPRPVDLRPAFDSLGVGRWRFAAHWGRVLLLANEPEPLARHLLALKQGRSLDQNPRYVRHQEGYYSRSHWMLYINPRQATGLPEAYLQDSFLPVYRSRYKGLLRELDALVFQAVREKERLIMQMTLGTGQPEEEAAPISVLWEHPLGAQLLHPPIPVHNHLTDRTEWICMDQAQRVSMVTPEGSMRWLRQLDENPLASIGEVDLYQNDKIQYLFSTPSQLWLLDRLGREVANYPIDLPDQAAAGIGAFPLGEDKRTVTFVGCENQRIYAFDATGEPLKGWSAQELQGNISVPFKYFGLRDQYYVFVPSEGGYFYLWDDQGNILREIDMKTQAAHPFVMQFAGQLDQCRLFSLDPQGRLITVTLNGGAERQPLVDWEGPLHFFPYDVTGDSRYNFLVANSEQFAVFEANGSKRRGRRFREPAHPESVRLYTASNGELLLVYAVKNGERIYFENYRTGALRMESPVKGNWPYYLGEGAAGRQVLITSGEDGKLWCYRIRRPES